MPGFLAWVNGWIWCYLINRGKKEIGGGEVAEFDCW